MAFCLAVLQIDTEQIFFNFQKETKYINIITKTINYKVHNVYGWLVKGLILLLVFIQLLSVFQKKIQPFDCRRDDVSDTDCCFFCIQPVFGHLYCPSISDKPGILC